MEFLLVKDEEKYNDDYEEVLDVESFPEEEYEESSQELGDDVDENYGASYQNNYVDYQNYYKKRYETMSNENNSSMNRLKNNNMNRMNNSRMGMNNNANGTDITTSSLTKTNEGNGSSVSDSSSLLGNNKNESKENNKLSNIFGKNKDGKRKIFFDLFGETKGKLKSFKIKLYLIIGGVLAFFILIMLIILFFDSLMSNFLNLTNWNYGSSDRNENINSDSNYSNDNSSSITSFNLYSLIGEDGVNSLTDKINSAGTNCTGVGVASKVVALIDGLNSYGYKVPFSNNASDNNLIVNPDWGIDSSGNKVGFNDLTFMNWALNAANVNNKITNINEYKDYVLPTILESSKPGDVIIYQNNIYMILQNIGTSVIIAYVADDGLTYKSYSYNDLKDYEIYNMNLYYIDNCNN